MTAQHPMSAELRSFPLYSPNRTGSAVYGPKFTEAADALDAMQAALGDAQDAQQQAEEYAALLIREKRAVQARCDALKDALDDAHKAIDAVIHETQNPENERIQRVAGDAVWKARGSKKDAERAHREQAEGGR